MCGICGIFNFASEAVSPPVLAKMTQAIAHRGPDSEGFHLEAQLGLGFRRLAIIDLHTGDQPIYSEDRRLVTIFNGEIYNFRRIRQELESLGHVFASNTDTEVLVHGYESWGLDLLGRLRGMYAFAIWDSGTQKLLLVRDRMGQKPLYYAQWGQTFLFASEVKAILQHPLARRAVNESALPEYLSLGYVTPPQTLFEGIYKLPPASFLQIEADGTRQEKTYWQAPPQKSQNGDYTDAIREKLRQAVELRMMSDVPLGTFLSGGVDSTAITALTGQLTGQAVKSFTVGFDFGQGSQGDQKFNADLHAARRAAALLNCDHHEIILKHDDILAQLLPQLVYALDEPIAESAIMQTIFVTALARYYNVPVLLSGDGADEIFGGYPFFGAARQVQAYQKIPRLLRQILFNPLIKQVASLKKLAEKAELETRAEHFLTWEARHPAPTVLGMMQKRELAQAGLENLHRQANELLAPLESPHLADYVAYAKLRWWLAEDSNMRTDKMAMWMSIEPRAPFEDHELVELALQIPLNQKREKAILKAAVRPFTPEFSLSRPKWGFNPPMSDWLRGPLRPLVDRFLADECLAASGFRPEAVRPMIESHMNRQGYFLHEIWTLLVFQLWKAVYIDQSQTPESMWSAQDIYQICQGEKSLLRSQY